VLFTDCHYALHRRTTNTHSHANADPNTNADSQSDANSLTAYLAIPVCLYCRSCHISGTKERHSRRARWTTRSFALGDFGRYAYPGAVYYVRHSTYADPYADSRIDAYGSLE
jgi:hypothetical protein